MCLCAWCYVFPCYRRSRCRQHVPHLFIINIWILFFCAHAMWPIFCNSFLFFLNSRDAPWPTQSQNAFTLPPFLLLLLLLSHLPSMLLFILSVYLFLNWFHYEQSTHIQPVKNQQQESVRAEIQLCTAFYIQSYWMPS